MHSTFQALSERIRFGAAVECAIRQQSAHQDEKDLPNTEDLE